ncbi:MAG: peptide deformylase [Clostridia bacterium]|jgi:peptide deformylase|nr:peptide deformylase [Clostridia bacterium]MCI9290840.1 peptide deformylase [Clostridia bacterium]
MALRDIVKDPNPTLRKICRPVEIFDDKLGRLLDDMKETMIKADGVGLAGPQVGILRRVAVVMVDDFYIEFVNPVIVKTKGSQIGPEACLSVPNKSGNVKRPFRVTVDYQDRHGKEMSVTAEGFIARAFCHEIDHLDGKLYYDFIEEK